MIPDGLYMYQRKIRIGFQTIVFPLHYRISPVGTPPLFTTRRR